MLFQKSCTALRSLVPGIMFRDHPDEVYAVRKDSPLIVGTSPEGNLIASDVPLGPGKRYKRCLFSGK